MNRRHIVAAGIILAALGCLAVPHSGATRRGPPPGDHTFYEVLRKNVVGGRVHYRGLKSRPRQLQKYLVDLANANLSSPWLGLDDDDRLAFWLNAYNACVIAGVIERYPEIKSVRDTKGFFSDRRWLVAGEKLSLDDIEGRTRSFSDPRIHFVLVCAARSCPPLQPYALFGHDLQEKLDKITRQVVNDERYVRLDPKTMRLRLTSIMSWYKQDFVDKYGSLEQFLIRYLDEPKRSQLKAGRYAIEFMPYDWALNDASPSARPPAR